jgi:hypothetical protein
MNSKPLPKRVVEIAEIERPAPAVPNFQLVAADATQLAALDLYRRGLNVFPLVRGAKDQHFGAWGRLQTTRLIDPDQGKSDDERAEHLEIFLRLFDDANIAVMVGRTSQNLTVLDCENEVSAQRHRREFERRGLRPWVVRSPRGFHFWWLSDREIANNQDDKAKPRGWEIRGHSCYVLCPPSVHPSGAIYEWCERENTRPPVIEIAALDWLPLTPAVTRRERIPFDPKPLARLFKRTQDFCENGTREGERNNRLFAAACDFAAKGFEIDDALPHLWRGCDASGYDKSFTRRHAEKTIASAYGKCRKSIKPCGPVPTWARAAAWAESHDWRALSFTIKRRGKTATKRVSKDTARAVFLACCARLRLEGFRGSGVFRAARREIAEIAGVGQKTVSNTLAALVQSGYLIDRGANAIGARLFAFPESKCSKVPSNREWFNTIGYFCTFGLAADVFSGKRGKRTGLPKSARRVWLAITEKPVTCAQIASKARCSVSTARRSLGVLEKHALARRVGRSKWLGEKCDDARLREIAQTCGTLGRTQERKEQHARERARFVTLQMAHNKDRREWARVLSARREE